MACDSLVAAGRSAKPPVVLLGIGAREGSWPVDTSWLWVFAGCSRDLPTINNQTMAPRIATSKSIPTIIKIFLALWILDGGGVSFSLSISGGEVGATKGVGFG